MPIQDLTTFFDLLTKTSELTSDEIELREKYFRSNIYGAANAVEVKVKLDDFFFGKSEPQETINKSKRFWYSYWRWYTMLNWSGFMGLSESDMLFAMAYQVPMAVALSFNPADELRRYLALNYQFKDDMIEIYNKIEPAFLASEAYIGMWQGKVVKLSEVIVELTDVGFEEDSLKQAEFQSKLAQILFSNNELAEKYFLTTSDVAVQRFVSLVIFFDSIDEDEIWEAVESFMYPEKYQGVPAGEAAPITAPAAPAVAAPKPVPASLKPAAPAPAPQPVAPKPVIQVQPAPAPKPAAPANGPSLTQIKSEIESQFKKDADGNFEDIATVLGMLSTLAEKYNNPKIADMLYFDEKENKFVWNV